MRSCCILQKMYKSLKSLSIGDYITNAGDIHPGFIGKVTYVSARSATHPEISVKVLKRPTRLAQINMPNEWCYPLDLAVNVFRKLTEAEKLLYTLD